MNNFEVEALIEIPMESLYKYEVNKDFGTLKVDRPLPRSIPYNYGYIPHTLHDDGDATDIFVIGYNNPIVALATVKVQLLGALLCNDNGVSDHKLIAQVVGEHWEDYIYSAK